MIFVPDAHVLCLEDSSARPLPQAFAKMFRWFGNMLRNNGRALALGPQRTGLFPWWCLLDQRLSIWTTLLGPSLALVLACTTDVCFLFFYLALATLRRVAYLTLLAFEGHRIGWRDVPLLYFSDWTGALMKICVLADLKNQRWAARQPGPAGGREWSHVLMANFRRIAWASLFFLAVLLYARR
jgi:mannuronan synthase